jgi:hypothetical protein
MAQANKPKMASIARGYSHGRLTIPIPKASFLLRASRPDCFGKENSKIQKE